MLYDIIYSLSIIEGNLMKITTTEDVIKSVEDNHIWLNAFQCSNPTPEFCEEIGRMILQKLSSTSNLVPKYNGDISGESALVQKTLNELAQLTPVLYLSINKS